MTTLLLRPDLSLYDSWRAAIEDFGADYPHGSGAPEDGQPVDPGTFEALVADRLRHADPTSPLPEGRVHCDFFWLGEEGTGDSEGPGGPAGPGSPEVIGFLALRHRLNDFLLEQGGHIGYSVRPTRRRQGHASRGLAAGVRRAAELGLAEVLVTCDEDNLGSRATIERAVESFGGRFEDVRGVKRRYWITTPAG